MYRDAIFSNSSLKIVHKGMYFLTACLSVYLCNVLFWRTMCDSNSPLFFLYVFWVYEKSEFIAKRPASKRYSHYAIKDPPTNVGRYNSMVIFYWPLSTYHLVSRKWSVSKKITQWIKWSIDCSLSSLLRTFSWYPIYIWSSQKPRLVTFSVPPPFDMEPMSIRQAPEGL